MNDRQKRQLIKEGKDIEKIEKLPIVYMTEMQQQDVTLDEAKIIIERMVCILEKSSRHRPETLLRDISLKTD